MLLFYTFQLFPYFFKTKLSPHSDELWFVSFIFTLDKISYFPYSSVIVNSIYLQIYHKAMNPNFILEL